MNTKKQSGIALVAAIFLVVIIAAAVTLLAMLSGRNSQLSTQSWLQLRAQVSANAGLEYLIQNIVLDPDTTLCALTAVETSGILIPDYSDYTVNVTCQAVAYGQTPQEFSLYHLEATSEYGTDSDADYAWAKITATVEP